MSSIISSVSDLVQSLVEVVWSLFTTAGHLVQNTLSFAVHIVESAINVVLEFFKGIIDLTGGLAQFVIGNILIIGVIAAGAFAFLQYQRKQGNTIKVGDKKLN